MKTSTTVSLFAATALLLAAANNCLAGTLTPSPSPSPQPSFSPMGVVSANTIALQQTSPSVLSILGDATITPVGTSVFVEGASGTFVTLTLTGTFTADAGDMASYFYNFNIALNSDAPATFTLTLSAGPLEISTGPQDIAANSNQSYSGGDQTPAAPFGTSGSFTAQLRIDFGAATQANDTLVLSIPAGSIDFAVAPVAIPEPSTYALVGVGFLALIVARRRRSLGKAA